MLRGWLKIARVFAAKGDSKSALKWAREARQADPKSFDVAKFLISRLILERNFDDALNLVLAQLQEHPSNLFVLELPARVRAGQSKIDDLRPLLRKMVDIASYDADWLTRIARIQHAAGLFEETRYTLSKAVESQPHDLPARALLAEGELRIGHADAAADIATTLSTEFATDPIGYTLLGEVAMARNRALAAVIEYGTALAMTAQNPALVLKRHLAMRAAGDNPGAATLLKEWLVAHPAERWAQATLVEHHSYSGNYAEAKRLFETYLSAQPKDAAALNNMASLLIKMKDYPRAKEYAVRAYDLLPADASVNDTFGWVLINLSQTEDGLRYLREARARAAAVPEIRFHLAVALHLQGRTKEALAELNEALRSDRDFEGKDQALALQRELQG